MVGGFTIIGKPNNQGWTVADPTGIAADGSASNNMRWHSDQPRSAMHVAELIAKVLPHSSATSATAAAAPVTAIGAAAAAASISYMVQWQCHSPLNMPVSSHPHMRSEQQWQQSDPVNIGRTQLPAYTWQTLPSATPTTAGGRAAARAVLPNSASSISSSASGRDKVLGGSGKLQHADMGAALSTAVNCLAQLQSLLPVPGSAGHHHRSAAHHTSAIVGAQPSQAKQAQQIRLITSGNPVGFGDHQITVSHQGGYAATMAAAAATALLKAAVAEQGESDCSC